MISRSGRGGLKAAWFMANIFANTSAGLRPLANMYPHLLVISALRWPSITGANRSRGGSLRLPTGFVYFGLGVMICLSLCPSGNRCSNAASKSPFQIYCPKTETLGGAMTKPPFDRTSTPIPIPFHRRLKDRVLVQFESSNDRHPWVLLQQRRSRVLDSVDQLFCTHRRPFLYRHPPR